MFAFVPVQTVGKNKRVAGFTKYVVSDLNMNEGKKILCFFDAGCEHCMDAAKSLTALSDSISNFPGFLIYNIIFIFKGLIRQCAA